MRYLVRARVKAGREADLLRAIDQERLGQGSVAEGEYLRNMQDARLCEDEMARWVEVCYCPTPLEEERPYWEEYFELTRIQDAHDRRKCRDENGSEPWACGDCDCTARLEEKLKRTGAPFLQTLRDNDSSNDRSVAVPFGLRPRPVKQEIPPLAGENAGVGDDAQHGRESADSNRANPCNSLNEAFRRETSKNASSA